MSHWHVGGLYLYRALGEPRGYKRKHSLWRWRAHSPSTRGAGTANAKAASGSRPVGPRYFAPCRGQRRGRLHRIRTHTIILFSQSFLGANNEDALKPHGDECANMYVYAQQEKVVGAVHTHKHT